MQNKKYSVSINGCEDKNSLLNDFEEYLIEHTDNFNIEERCICTDDNYELCALYTSIKGTH